MKGLLRVGTVLVVCALLVMIGRSAPEPAKAPPPVPRSRIVLVNLNYVVKNYKKFIAFQGEMRKVLGQHQTRDKELAEQIDKLTKEIDDLPKPFAGKDELEKALETLKQDREKNGTDGKAELARKSDQGMVELYTDVQKTVAQYAKAKDIELVMHYNDALDPVELESAANIARKLQAGACVPLYQVPGVDVSEEIVAIMNGK